MTTSPLDGKNARTRVSRVAFPASLVAALWGTTVLMDRGGEPGQVAGQVIFVSYVFIATLERLVPLHEEWRRDKRDRRADLGLGITNAITNGVVQPLAFAASVAVSAWIAARYGSSLWPFARRTTARIASTGLMRCASTRSTFSSRGR